MTTTKKLSFYFEISQGTTYVGTPVQLSNKNDLDNHGVKLDLKRLPRENGVDYYKRLRSVIPLRAGAHQEGLVHGITRELGLEEKTALKITPTTYGDGWLARSPRVDITSTKITLYSQYEDDGTNVIDVEVDIIEHGDGYLLNDLVETLQVSEYFDISLGSGMTGKEKSLGLIPSSSNKITEDEVIQLTKFYFLDRADVVPGSLSFEDLRVYETEVTPIVNSGLTGTGVTFSFGINTTVGSDGEYYVNYKEGSVLSYLAPAARTKCRYAYRDFPFRVRWAPLAVYNLKEEEYREKVFERETMLDNTSKEALVTAEGKEIYDIIFRKSPSMWGV